MFNCTECELKFISEALLDYHTNASHNVDDLTTHCKLCVLNYKTISGFLQHKFRIHCLLHFKHMKKKMWCLVATVVTNVPSSFRLVIILQENINLVASCLRSSLKIMKGTVVFATWYKDPRYLRKHIQIFIRLS